MVEPMVFFRIVDNILYTAGDVSVLGFEESEGLRIPDDYLEKHTSKHVVKYVVDFMELNKEANFYSDENYISILRHNSDIKNILTTLNNKYNVGLTHMEQRYEAADKPVCSLGFQPHVQNSWEVFVEGKNKLNIKLVDNEMVELFKKYNLVPE